MSLLMDALRKAEESKKKVASKAPGESDSPPEPPVVPAPPRSRSAQAAPPAAPRPTVPAAPKPAPAADDKPAARQPIPDFTMEFDESEPASSASESSAVSTSTTATETDEDVTSDIWSAAEEVDTKTPSIDVPLEATSEETSEATSEATPETKSEPPVAPERATGVEQPEQPAQDLPTDSAPKSAAAPLELAPREVADSRKPLDVDATPDYRAAVSAPDQPEAGKEAVSKSSGSTLALEVESPELPKVQPGPEPATRPQADSLTSQTASGSSIRERSAGHRASARSVFSAKKPQQQRRRQQLLLAGGGVVVVLLLGVGVVFYLSSGSNSGITVPDNYVASQDFSSGEVERNDEVDLFDEPGTADQQALDPQEPVSSELDAGQQTAFAQATDNDSSAGSLASAPAIIPPLEPSVDIAEPVATTSSVSAPTSPGGASPAAGTSTAAVPERDTGSAGQAAAPESSAAQDAVQTQSTSAAVTATASATAASTPVQSAPTISFTRRQPEPAAEPQLNQAYAAFQRGDFGQARALYESVLIEAPLHRDALLGLAAIAVENQQPGQAMEYYSRLLARNPADPVARTALLELSPAGGPAVQERELRRLQERHPGVAPLAYSLGNFYASRQQWTDAQQHYFRALQLAKSTARQPSDINPDYAFNLAVSLEHLGQGRAALSFYREALEQSTLFPASFDVALVRNRIESLGRTLTP